MLPHRPGSPGTNHDSHMDSQSPDPSSWVLWVQWWSVADINDFTLPHRPGSPGTHHDPGQLPTHFICDLKRDSDGKPCKGRTQIAGRSYEARVARHMRQHHPELAASHENLEKHLQNVLGDPTYKYITRARGTGTIPKKDDPRYLVQWYLLTRYLTLAPAPSTSQHPISNLNCEYMLQVEIISPGY